MNIAPTTTGPAQTGTAPTGPSLRGLLGAHLIMIRTPGGLVLLALSVLIPLAVLVLNLLIGQQTFDLTGADLAAPLTSCLLAGALLAPLLGGLVAGSLYRHGTIVPTLLAAPRRLRVVVSTLLTAGGLAVTAALLYTVVGAAITLPWLATEGVAIGEVLADPDLWWRLLGGTAVVVVLAVLGAALAVLLRGLLGPVLVLIGLFVLEGSLIAYVTEEWVHWSFLAGLVALTDPANLTVPLWRPVLLVTGVLAAVVTAALVSTARRDAA